jgi:hypothetical protein
MRVIIKISTAIAVWLCLSNIALAQSGGLITLNKEYQIGWECIALQDAGTSIILHFIFQNSGKSVEVASSTITVNGENECKDRIDIEKPTSKDGISYLTISNGSMGLRATRELIAISSNPVSIHYVGRIPVAADTLKNGYRYIDIQGGSTFETTYSISHFKLRINSEKELMIDGQVCKNKNNKISQYDICPSSQSTIQATKELMLCIIHKPLPVRIVPLKNCSDLQP